MSGAKKMQQHLKSPLQRQQYNRGIVMVTDDNNSTNSAKSKLRSIDVANIFKRAIMFNNHVLVKRLLAHKGVNPAANDNAAVILAATYGHAEILALLLRDQRVDPAARDFEALWVAISCGNSEIVKLLFTDGKIDPAIYDNEPLKSAALGLTTINSHYDIVVALLQDDRANPSAEFNAPIRYAAEHGNIRITKLLLRDRRVDPTARCNYALQAAVYNGHLDVVRLLLSDPRVDANDLDGRAFQFAENNKEILVLLQEWQANKSTPIRHPVPELKTSDLEQYYFNPDDDSS